MRGLRAPLQSPPPTLISSSRYQVACFAALTLAYTIAGNQVRQTGTVKQDKKGTLLHRLRTMFYCRCQGLSRAFDSCDSIAQTFVFEALISCVDSLARAGDPCFESLGRIQGAVAPPAKPCALLSLPLSYPFPISCSVVRTNTNTLFMFQISSPTYLNITCYQECKRYCLLYVTYIYIYIHVFSILQLW